MGVLFPCHTHSFWSWANNLRKHTEITVDFGGNQSVLGQSWQAVQRDFAISRGFYFHEASRMHNAFIKHACAAI